MLKTEFNFEGTVWTDKVISSELPSLDSLSQSIQNWLNFDLLTYLKKNHFKLAKFDNGWIIVNNIDYSNTFTEAYGLCFKYGKSKITIAIERKNVHIWSSLWTPYNMSLFDEYRAELRDYYSKFDMAQTDRAYTDQIKIYLKGVISQASMYENLIKLERTNKYVYPRLNHPRTSEQLLKSIKEEPFRVSLIESKIIHEQLEVDYSELFRPALIDNILSCAHNIYGKAGYFLQEFSQYCIDQFTSDQFTDQLDPDSLIEALFNFGECRQMYEPKVIGLTQYIFDQIIQKWWPKWYRKISVDQILKFTEVAECEHYKWWRAKRKDLTYSEVRLLKKEDVINTLQVKAWLKWKFNSVAPHTISPNDIRCVKRYNWFDFENTKNTNLRSYAKACIKNMI